MVHANDIGGACVSRALCESIKLLTEQRLAFDTRMGERARASDATPPLSPNRNRQHGDQTSHGKGAEAAHSAAERSHDLRLAQQPAGLHMSKEARVTYMKLRGDQLLHLAEMARHNSGFSTSQCEGLAAEALEAYLSAQQEACSKMNDSNTATNTVNSSSGNSIGNCSALPELHPLQVELALRISSVLLHLLDRPVEAWEVGYPIYLVAAEYPTRLGARGLAITQALRDHLACIDIHSGRGQQREGRGNSSEQTVTRHDSSSATLSRQGTARGTGEDGHEECIVEGEWGFLRVSAECDEARGQGVGGGTNPSEKLRNLAQVKQARACMEAVTAADRLLLGTMEHADVVHLALKQIFFAYTKQYAKPAQNWLEDSKNLSVQGRKATPQAYLRQGPFLSWAGLEAVCQDFHITATPSSSAVGPASRHPRPLANHLHARHHPVRVTSLDHQPPTRGSPGASAPKTTRKQDSPTRASSGESLSRGLLSGVQVCIAFMSACTQGPMVASFPNGGKSDGAVGGENARRDRTSCGGSAKGREMMSNAEEDAAYWRGLERVVLSGSAALEASSAPGLNFRQFVDALSRCGLLGFSGKNIDGTTTLGRGFGGGIGITPYKSQLTSTAERVQAMFITRMRLLDSKHVDARLQQLVHPPSTNHEGEVSAEGHKMEGFKQRYTRGHAAGGDHGGKKKKGHAARGTNAGGPRGGSRKAVAVDPKPAAVLAPIQTTPRGRETIA